MRCKKVEDLLVLYIEDKLEAGLKEKVERHLHDCKNCSALLDKLQNTAKQLQSLDAKKLPADFYSGLQAKLAQAQAGHREERFWLFNMNILVPLATAASFILIFAFSLDFFSSRKPVIPEPHRAVNSTKNNPTPAVKIEVKKTIELAKYTDAEAKPAIFRGSSSEEYKKKKTVKQWQDIYSGITTKISLIIKNQDEWQKLWKAHTKNMKPAPLIPDVDFNNNTVVAVFMGEKNSGGYGINISKIEESENNIYIELEETIPSPGAAIKQHPTQPYHIVVINKK